MVGKNQQFVLNLKWKNMLEKYNENMEEMIFIYLLDHGKPWSLSYLIHKQQWMLSFHFVINFEKLWIHQTRIMKYCQVNQTFLRF